MLVSQESRLSCCFLCCQSLDLCFSSFLLSCLVLSLQMPTLLKILKLESKKMCLFGPRLWKLPGAPRFVKELGIGMPKAIRVSAGDIDLLALLHGLRSRPGAGSETLHRAEQPS